MAGALDTSLNDTIRATLDELSRSHASLCAQLEDPGVLADHRQVRDISIRKAALDAVVEQYAVFQNLDAEAAELHQALTGDDAELAALAKEELPRIQELFFGSDPGETFYTS